MFLLELGMASQPRSMTDSLSVRVETSSRYQDESVTSHKSPRTSLADSSNTGTKINGVRSSGSSSGGSPSGAVFSESHNLAAKYIRENLLELKQRQIALRRAQAVPEPECTSLSEPLSWQRPIRSVVAPPSEIFASPPSQPTQITESSYAAASLHSVRDRLCVPRARQEVIRKDRDEQDRVVEDTVQFFEDQHRASMVHCCDLEEQANSALWACVLKVDPPLREGMLRFVQVPWPVLPLLVYSPEDITAEGTARFLLYEYRQPHLSKREKLEKELDRWTDPEFDSRVILRVRHAHREKLYEGQRRVSVALKKLMESLQS